MITERAQITIDPANASAFEAAVASIAPLFSAAQGYGGMSLERELENPGRYRLNVLWEKVEDHMVTFRASPAFAQWRATVGPYFVGTPSVVHTQTTCEFK